MSVKDIQQVPASDAQEWERRRKGNVRLAWGFVGFAVLVFLISLWKYRPL